MMMTSLALVLGLIGLVGFVLAIWGGIRFLIAAFRVSALWGVLVLFVPFANFVFAFKYWAEAKRGFLMNLAGAGICFGTGVLASIMLPAMLAQQMGEQMAAQMQAEMEKQMAAQGTQDMEGMQGMQGMVGVQTTETEQAPAPEAYEAHMAAQQTREAERQAQQQADQAGIEEQSGQIAINRYGELPEDSPAISLNPLDAIAPDALPDKKPLSFDPIPYSRAGEHVGEHLQFVRMDGRAVDAELVAVEGGKLRVRRYMPHGELVYPLSREEIARILPTN
jgi:hypothetical protein